MTKTHELKTWPGYYQAIVDGDKTFEIRRNDRDFRKGDRLILREWCPTQQNYTCRETRVYVTYLLHGRQGSPFGLSDGAVCMAISLLPHGHDRIV